MLFTVICTSPRSKVTTSYKSHKFLYESGVDQKSRAHTNNSFTALWILFGTARVSRYQKKHSSTPTIKSDIYLYKNYNS